MSQRQNASVMLAFSFSELFAFSRQPGYPVNRRFAAFGQPLIRLHEMITAKEPAVGGERRRVRRFEHAVALAIDYRAFLLRMRTP